MLTEQIRQGLALCILLFGVYALYYGRTKRFIVIVLISSLFHISAVMAFLFLFIRGTSEKGLYKFTLAASIFVVALLYSLYHPELFSSLPLIGPKLPHTRDFEEKDVGFWSYVLGSRLVFIYLFLYIFFVFRA
jgi:hypothetical protein